MNIWVTFWSDSSVLTIRYICSTRQCDVPCCINVFRNAMEVSFNKTRFWKNYVSGSQNIDCLWLSELLTRKWKSQSRLWILILIFGKVMFYVCHLISTNEFLCKVDHLPVDCIKSWARFNHSHSILNKNMTNVTPILTWVSGSLKNTFHYGIKLHY